MTQPVRPRSGVSLALSLLVLLISLSAPEMPAQRKSIKQYVHDQYTTANGLPQNGADDILQTRDGYLWFATQEGLTRFDGVEFTVFDKTNTPVMANSWIVALEEDSAGGLWFRPQGFAPGVVRYANGAFTLYALKNGLPSNSVNTWAAGPDGTVWLGTDRGLAEWKGEILRTYTRKDGLPSDSVFALGLDREQGLWISTPNGLARIRSGKVEMMTGAGLRDTIVTPFSGGKNVFEDSRGTLWMTSPGSVIAYADGAFRHYGIPEGLPDSIVISIAEDRNGTVWFGTRQGLGRFSDGRITAIRASANSSENRIREIRVDREGSLWLRTREGIARYADGKFEFFGEKEGLTGNAVQRILIDKEGSIWSSSSGAGVDRFRDGKFVTYSTRVGLSHDLINTVFEDRGGNLWIGTEGGLNRMKDGVLTAYGTGKNVPGPTVGGLGEDPEGSLWITASNGIWTYRNGSFTLRLKGEGQNLKLDGGIVRRNGEVLIVSQGRALVYQKGAFVPYPPLDGLHIREHPVFRLYETRSRALWVTTFDSVYQLTEGRLVNFSETHHLPAIGAVSITEDSAGAVWIGIFGEGLYRYKDGSLVNVSPKQGLFDYNAYTFLEDRFGFVWLSSNRGVYRVSKKELDEVADGKRSMLTSDVYGTADGMESRECNATGSPAGWVTRDGRICFTTTIGLATVNPAELRINPIPPPVVIDRFLVEGDPQDTRGSISIPAGKTRFELHYAGLSFIGAKNIRYKYQLEGLDEDWVDAGVRREAYFTHLDPGEYTFRVIAANSDGIWNDTGASVSITLEPHFYQTKWFIGLAILFFVTSGPAFYYNRMRSMKKRRAELEQQVLERTGELQKTLDNLKETQNQLILSEKMASLGQLTAGIAHEIKNPLNFITNFAVLSHDLMKDLRKELAAERKNVDPTRAKEIEEVLTDLDQNVSKINEHGKRADSIVRGMLLHSRGKAGERQETDVNALLAEYTNLAYHGMRAQDQSFNVKIETDFDPGVGTMHVVPQDLSRAFLNIVNNACYAAYDKRRTATNGFSPTVRVSARGVQDRVEIRIRDNGNGIPPSVREKIFNPFFTTKPAGVGTGLGLSLTYDIITQEHQGEITVDTKEGEYTEFIITLPRHPETEGRKSA